MTIPLRCLGFALTPKFNDKHYLQNLAPVGMKRKPPNDDKEVVLGVMDEFKKIAENEDEEKILRALFAKFHLNKGIYSRVPTQADAVTMDLVDWWATYVTPPPLVTY